MWLCIACQFFRALCALRAFLRVSAIMRVHSKEATVSANTPHVTEKKRDGPRKWIPRFGNLLLWLLLCAMSGTGLLLAYRLPPGSRGGHGLSALGWTRHDWGDLHRWISFAFLALIVIHMILHWRWFWQIACRKRAWPLCVGVLAGLALLIGIVMLPVNKDPDSSSHESRARQTKHSEDEEPLRGGKRFRGGRD